MAKASAFCPAYVTCIFTIGDADAAGAGFAIDRGITTAVSGKKSGRSAITINGSETAAPTSKAVVRRFSELCGRTGLLEIAHETQVPVGFGLGASAAGALSLSLALNEFLGAGLSRERCVRIAHDAEVECGTGLSGADAAAIGGILARKKIGEKPVKIEAEQREIEIALFSPMKTSAIIRDDIWKRKVNAAGEEALEMLFRKKNWGALVDASRQFTAHSGLGSWCEAELDRNTRASMAMLGQTLWSDMPLQLGRQPMKSIKCTLRKEGAELV